MTPQPPFARSAPRGWTGFYMPEIHDLAPCHAAGLEALIALFPAPARPCIAHSIVPDWQGRWPLATHPAFCARLASLPGTPVLHGLTHSLGPDWLNWLLYGHDNRSEFRSLSRADAGARLDQGLKALTLALGRAPRWFCAPRWQEGRHLPALLAERGFQGWLGRNAIHRPGQAPVPLPALNFDEGARAWRQALGLVARRATIAGLLHSRKPFRLVLHPDDLRRPATLRQIRALIDALEAAGWVAESLDGVLGRWQGAT